MKKILTALTLSGLVLTLGAGQAFAATTTKGTGEFDVDTDNGWEVIKPNPDPDEVDEVILPTDPIQPEVVSDVILLHAPSFDFGKNKISTANADYDALFDSAKKDSTGQAFAMPHFVQVGDASGSLATKWKVEVSQIAEFASGANKLKNATIDFYGTTATNSMNPAANVVKELSISASGKDSIPYKADGKLEVLKRKDAVAGQEGDSATTGTISSVVFHKNYVADDFKETGANSVGDRTDQVKLHVPKQQVVKGTYTADLEWTLTVAP